MPIPTRLRDSGGHRARDKEPVLFVVCCVLCCLLCGVCCVFVVMALFVAPQAACHSICLGRNYVNQRHVLKHTNIYVANLLFKQVFSRERLSSISRTRAVSSGAVALLDVRFQW